jgi:hypothetical protein
MKWYVWGFDTVHGCRQNMLTGRKASSCAGHISLLCISWRKHKAFPKMEQSHPLEATVLCRTPINMTLCSLYTCLRLENGCISVIPVSSFTFLTMLGPWKGPFIILFLSLNNSTFLWKRFLPFLFLWFRMATFLATYLSNWPVPFPKILQHLPKHNSATLKTETVHSPEISMSAYNHTYYQNPQDYHLTILNFLCAVKCMMLGLTEI